jgi:hypothetical protein
VNCKTSLRNLSSHRDGELAAPIAGDLEVHLALCPSCASTFESMGKTLDLFSALPRTDASIVPDVLSRLEVESRGPGLALLFCTPSSRRPALLPSLFWAAAGVLAISFGILALDHPTLKTNVPVLAGLTLPTIRERGAQEGVLGQMGIGTLFVQTVVGPDGSVSTIRVLNGNVAQTRPVVEALLKDRFEPALLRGRPVAVNVFRLISRMDVWARAT